MNTRMDVIMWGQEMPVLEEVFLIIQQKTAEIEGILSRFDTNAETHKINQQAGTRAVVASDFLFDTLNECLSLSTLTNGYFNISYLTCKSTGTIQLDPKRNTIQFSCSNTKIDFGAIGKGIALKSIATILENSEVKNAFVSFGDSSILTRGKHPHGDYWPVGFQPQFRINETLRLNNGCLSVSGLHNGKAHIYNPITGEKCAENKAIGVVCDNPVVAEALSTALIVAPREQHAEILRRFGDCHIFYSMPDKITQPQD